MFAKKKEKSTGRMTDSPLPSSSGNQGERHSHHLRAHCHLPPPVSSPIQIGVRLLAGLSVVFASRHRKLLWRALLGKGIKLHSFNERESNERVRYRSVYVGHKLYVKELAENECKQSAWLDLCDVASEARPWFSTNRAGWRFQLLA